MRAFESEPLNTDPLRRQPTSDFVGPVACPVKRLRIARRGACECTDFRRIALIREAHQLSSVDLDGVCGFEWGAPRDGTSRTYYFPERPQQKTRRCRTLRSGSSTQVGHFGKSKKKRCYSVSIAPILLNIFTSQCTEPVLPS